MLLVGGCGRSSPTKEIDVAAMQHELAAIVHQRFLAQGYDYDARVKCDPTGEPLTFSCDVRVKHHPRVHRIEIIVCRTLPAAHGLQRCSASTGDALQ
jgi:hypothetical protein